MSNEAVTIVEVGPRDGFQSITHQIPAETKVALIGKLYTAGIRRMETTAFVSPKAVPQLADAAEVLAAAQVLPGLDSQVLVPNLRNAERAIEVGAQHIAYVLSVSRRHNMSNVRRSPQESVTEFAQIMKVLPPGTRVRLNLATAFDCPFTGAIGAETTLDLLEELLAAAPEAEICPCDTTGRVAPDRVQTLFEQARARFPQVVRWAYHGHDTYGLGVANVLAAMRAGVRVFDSSFAGLGGCPFAPGATGNVATEDLVWTLDQMGIQSGVNFELLLEVARDGTRLPSALHGGRVRAAVDARQCREDVVA